MKQAILGIIMGGLVGACLYKAKMLKYDEQVSSMIFKKMTLLKFFMAAQMTSLLTLSTLRILGFVQITHGAFNWFNAMVGGLVFGIGWGILGYCPGTCSGAIGTGKIDGIFGLAGIICGSILYAFMFPVVSAFSAQFLVGYIGLSDPVWMIATSVFIVFIYLLLFRSFEKRNL